MGATRGHQEPCTDQGNRWVCQIHPVYALSLPPRLSRMLPVALKRLARLCGPGSLRGRMPFCCNPRALCRVQSRGQLPVSGREGGVLQARGGALLGAPPQSILPGRCRSGQLPLVLPRQLLCGCQSLRTSSSKIQ